MNVHHPLRNRDNHPIRPLHLEELAGNTLLDPPHDDLPAEKGMPTVVNFPLFADMGRMNG